MHSSKIHFQPILLGSDINVYGMARSFYEQYRIKSIALCSSKLSPTKDSKIITVYSLSKLEKESTFVETLKEFHKNQLQNNTRYLLIACGDRYAKLLSKFQEDLKDLFLFATIPFSDYTNFEEKAHFYKQCDFHQLAYPNTIYLEPSTWEHTLVTNQKQIQFPIVLKASDSISYVAANIKNKKKAYKLNSLNELKEIIQSIYASSYVKPLILQEYIPGDDSHMRVMNVYVDQHHKVRAMAFGQPLLEDPSPESIGNYLAILPTENKLLYQQITTFLEAINYQGFANFDFKFDKRDGCYKVFEMNLRQGRSSFFSVLNGINLAQYITEDLVLNKPFSKIVYNNQNKLWLGAPFSLVYHYVSDPSIRKKMRQYFYHRQLGTTLFYRRDISIKRFILQSYSFLRYAKKFKKHFKEE